MGVHSVSASRPLLATQSIYDASLNFATADVASGTAGTALQSLTEVTIYARVSAINSSTGRIFNKAAGATGRFALAFDSQTFKFIAGWTGTGQWRTNAFSRKNGDWQDIIVKYSFSATSNDPTFYVNGVKQNVLGQDANPTGTASADDSNYYIGNRSGANAGMLGKVQNIQVYNRLITDDEAWQLHATGAPLETGLVGHWKMNEGTGTALVDSSGISGNATITGATWSTEAPFAARTASGTRQSLTPNNSLVFDGVDDYAQYPIIPDPDGFCFGGWIYVPVATEAFNRHLISWQDADTVGGFKLNIINSASQFQFSTYTGSATSDLRAAFSGIGWHHVTGTWLPAEAKLYLNAGLKATDTSAGITPSSSVMTFGKRSYTEAFAAFSLYDFVFENTETPWTQTEINKLYYHGIKPDGASYYQFKNIGQDSVNGNTIKIFGATYSDTTPSIYRTAV